MKKNYPVYRKLKLSNVGKKLSKENKKLINGFLDYCKITAGNSSIMKIESKIIQIADIIEKPLNKLNLKDLHEFLALLNRSGRAIETQNDTKKVLKRFLRWKYKDWSRKFNELRDIRTQDGTNHEKLNAKTILTEEDLELLLRKAESLRLKALLILMFESAGRPEELLKTRWKDLDLTKNEIKLHSSKTGRTRVIPLNEAIIHLKRYKQEYPYMDLKAEDYIFPSPVERNEPISLQAVHNHLRELEKITKLKRHIYPYIFRHTRLTALHKKLSPKVYEKFAGHSMEVATKRYAHMSIDDVREEMLERVFHIEELTKEENQKIGEMKAEIASFKREVNKKIFELAKKISN